MPDELTQRITRLRGEASEASLEQATKLEAEAEKDLAKNGSDEEIQRRRYDPEALRKAHRNTQAKRQNQGGGGSKKKEK